MCGLTAVSLLLTACSDGKSSTALAKCQTDLQTVQQQLAITTGLQQERDELNAALESVTRELVMVKVERDKMAVELRAYSRK